MNQKMLENKKDFIHIPVLKLRLGFTLIELMVAISIIGVLSLIVLASVNIARSKGADATARSSLAGARSQAGLFYDVNSYKYSDGTALNSVCDPAALVSNVKGIYSQIKSAITAVGGSGAVVFINSPAPALETRAICNNIETGWAAEIKLRNGDYLCVDYIGSYRESDSRGLRGNDDVSCFP